MNSEIQYVGILFADIRGYSNLSSEEVNKFHREYLPRLWDSVVNDVKPILKGAKTWGDGITCVSEDIIKLSEFSLKLASGFDGIEWKANIYHPLRLRTALHTGFLYPSEDPVSSNKIEQYTGLEMVKPARLEPVVRPGQVWCTRNFKMAVLNKISDLSDLKFIFDDLEEISFAKGYGSYPVHRIRFKRGENENQLQIYENKMKQAKKVSDRGIFLENIQALLNTTSREFVYLSKYLSWYEVLKEMTDLQLYREGEEITREFKKYLDKKGWLSEEIEVHLTCLLANCVSHKHDANFQELQQTLADLERLSNTKRDEVSMLISETYKKMGMALIHSQTVQEDTKRNIFLQSHENFLEIFNKREIEEPRLFPELKLLPNSRSFNHIAAINIAEVTAFLECLSFDEQESESFKCKREQFSRLLIDWFNICPPQSESESEILAFVLANILLGNPQKSAEVLRTKPIPSELKKRLETIANFPGMADTITRAARQISRNIKSQIAPEEN